MVETTYSAARANLGQLCDRVSQDRQVVLIRRRKRDDVALIAADELAGLLETAYLLHSPRNRQRLLPALRRATARKGRAQTPAQLRRELGLNRES